MSEQNLISKWRDEFCTLTDFEAKRPPINEAILPRANSHVGAYIDHTLLKASATQNHVFKLCQEAITHSFASVCIYPSWVKEASTLLEKSSVTVCTVIGFPHGNTPTQNKIQETKRACLDGATEIDMVIQLGALKSKDVELVFHDIRSVVAAAKSCTVKVIIEASALTQEEKIQACLLAEGAGAHFLKTSTGFGDHGATISDVELMAKIAGNTMQIKASGGIRSLEAAKNMMKAGATRLGTSASVDIVSGLS